jgi:hypothetical protein
MEIVNKSPKPIAVPLPGGRRLFLGPGKSGQVTPKALEHPPLAKLVEVGDLSVTREGSAHPKAAGSGGGKPVPKADGRHAGPGPKRQSGDR